MIRAGEMRFARIGLKPECRLDRRFAQSQALRRVVIERIRRIVRKGELTVRGEERGIARQRLVEQIDSLAQVLRADSTKAGVKNEVLRPAIKFKSGDVVRRALLDRTFLRRREFRL